MANVGHMVSPDLKPSRLPIPEFFGFRLSVFVFREADIGIVY